MYIPGDLYFFCYKFLITHKDSSKVLVSEFISNIAISLKEHYVCYSVPASENVMYQSTATRLRAEQHCCRQRTAAIVLTWTAIWVLLDVATKVKGLGFCG